MALGFAGGSGGTSSSSNLSALAPPFIVDRFNPKPNSNPHLNLSDMSYGGGGGAPSGLTWQHMQHSETRHDVFPEPELVVNGSTRTSCMPLSNECHYSVPVSLSPSSTQWSGLKPGVDMPLSNDYHYSVSDSVIPSNPQWSDPPFVHNWQYHSPNLSEPGADVLPKAKLDADDSARTKSMPLANDCHYSVPDSINPSSTQWVGLNPSTGSSSNAFYVAERKHYCPGYVSSVECEENSLISLNESGSCFFSASGLGNVSSQVGYAEGLSGLEPAPQWGGVWNGLAEANRGKQVESGGSLSVEKVNDGVPLVCKDYMIQGPAVESKHKSRGDSGISYGKSTDGIQRGSFGVKNTDEESLFAQEFCSGTLYGKSADVIGKESCSGSLSVGNVNKELVYTQKLGVLPLESSGTQFLGSRSPFSELQPQYGFQESSKDLFNYQKKYGPHETSGQPLHRIMEDSVSFVNPSHAVVIRAPVNGTSPVRDPVTHETIGIGNVTNVCTKLLDGPKHLKSKESDILPCPGSIGGPFNTVKLNMGNELLGKPQNEDSTDTMLTRKSVVTDTLSLAQSFKCTENSSDSLDNPNPAEDSPCWKGAPASHYTPTPHHLQEKLEGSCNLYANGNHITPRENDSRAADCQKQFEDNAYKKIGCTGVNAAPYPNSTSSCPDKEHRSTDSGTNFDDALQCGSVAYRTAENVLCSPSAEDNYVECNQPSGREATPTVDVRTLINAIYSLSEILCFSCSVDSCRLVEQEQEVLKHVISNLNACMSEKIINSIPAPGPKFSQKDTSDSTVKGQCAEKRQQRYQGTMKSYGQHDHQYMHTENIRFIESGKKSEHMPYLLPLVDDVPMSRDEDMVQAIKKVLDANFNVEEDIQPQNLLFKNLWLEAEAKLCSISYKARFDRLRILMEKHKTSKKKEIAADTEGVPGSNSTPGLSKTVSAAFLDVNGSVPEGTIAKLSTYSTNSHADDGEASVLARFDMLKRRDDKPNSGVQQLTDMVDTGKVEGQFGSYMGGFVPEGTITDHSTFTIDQGDGVDSSVFAKFDMFRRRDDISNPEEKQQPSIVDVRKAGCFDPKGTMINPCTFGNNDARYNMLSCGDEKLYCKEQQQQNMLDTRKADRLFQSSVGDFGPEDNISEQSTCGNTSRADEVEAAVLARFNILKCRDEKSNTEEQQLPHLVNAKKAGGRYGSYIGVSLYEPIKEFSPTVTNGRALNPDRTFSVGNENSSRWIDNSLSHWEHVLKDDLACQKFLL